MLNKLFKVFCQEPQEEHPLSSIIEQMKGLDDKQALYLASYAYLLVRGAYSDWKLDETEESRIAEILKEKSILSEDQIEKVISLIHNRTEIYHGTEGHLVTRNFKEIASFDDKKDLIRNMFAVAAADENITSDEEKEIQ